MAIILTTSARDTLCDAIVDMIDNGAGAGKLDFYVDGTTDYNSYITEVSLVTSVDGTNLLDLKPTHEAQTNLGSVTIDASGGLYLKVKMKEIDMTTPVIRGCELQYYEV